MELFPISVAQNLNISMNLLQPLLHRISPGEKKVINFTNILV